MFLALDQGTTSSRAIVFDRDGTPRGIGQREFPQYFPAPGHVEHDPLAIVTSQLEAAAEAIRAAGNPTIEAAGITNQRETVVVWDRRTGQPIHRAIVWQDRRTQRVLDELKRAGHEERVREQTGLPLDPYFSAAKIAHILDAVPGARAAAERGELCAGTIDAWLVYGLTGGEVFATDSSNASRTSLFDLRTGAFDDGLCRMFGVPRRCLPEVRDTAGDFGMSRQGWPIRAVIGDQQSALFAHDCVRPGDGKCTYGTGAFLLQNAGTAPPRPVAGVLSTVAWRVAGTTTYAYEGSVLMCGAVIQWLRDQLGLLRTAAESEVLARSVADSGDVVFVPSFVGLGTPRWDPTARGLLVGLTRGTTKAHIVRAALEGMALQVDDVLSALRGDAPPRLLHVDGGASANGLLLEIQASLLGAPIERPALLEATAFGAFRMALLGSGAGPTVDELPRLPGVPTNVVPTLPPAAIARLRERWHAAVPRAAGWSPS